MLTREYSYKYFIEIVMSAEENTNIQPETSAELNKDRRNWLIATSVMGGIGGAGVVLPLVNTFAPSEKAKAAGAPVEMDITGMQPGELRTVDGVESLFG
jgi:ubiquinol-cytochrome c reductase iron-sulfur subunit